MFYAFIILAVAALLVALAIWGARCWGLEAVGRGRLRIPLNRFPDLAGERFTSRDGLHALAWGLGALALVYGASLLYCGILGEGVSWSGFHKAWKHYDAYHYLKLAELGYAGYTEGGQPLFLVFFPLYPWLMRLLHLVIPNYAVCGHLLSSLCFLGSCYMLARLVTEEFGRKLSRLSLAFLTAYPFAFFFASIHTESLFLLLSLASFYFIRKHRYPLAGLFGALAALTRMQGVFLAVVALAEYCLTEHPLSKLRRHAWRELWRDLWGKLFWIACMALGVGVYLLLNYVVAGDPFRFLTYQRQHWYQGFAPFTTSLYKLWQGALHPTKEYLAYTTWGPQVALFAFCVAVLLYGARRLPPVWTLYFLICLLLNYSLNNPLSCCRYIACAFPLPAALAMGAEKRPGAGRFLLVSYGVLQGVYLFAYLAGKHVC